jgi:hypothetical protein
MAGTKKTSSAVQLAGSQSGHRSQPDAKNSQSHKSPTKRAQLGETQASKSQGPSQAIQLNKPGSSQLPQSKDQQKSIPYTRG